MLEPTEYELNQLRHVITGQAPPKQISPTTKVDPRTGLMQSIQNLEGQLKKLEALIKKRENEEASENRKRKAKQERSAKETDKPKVAAEKAEKAREFNNGNSSDKKSGSKKSIAELKSLATKVRGQIAVAKQKLAAL